MSNSTFHSHNDRPNQIKIEGSEITLKFQRTSDTTARISWNIPAPANGCSADNQAYDGIVITVSAKPANYINSSPKDATYYNGDTTADYDLHAGDTIDEAFVLGAFYHDKTTTFLDIDGIQPKTPYYVSGYAVDNVGRYHREGVHAYSLPTGPNSKELSDSPAYHDIGLHTITGITGNTPTGLNRSSSYFIPIRMGDTRYVVNIKGIDAHSYNDLINAINNEFVNMIPSYKSPSPPNAKAYYFDAVNLKLYLWDGYQNIEQVMTTSITDPSVPELGAFWYDGTVLYQYESGGWVVMTNVITTPFDPTDPQCDQLWLSGDDVWEWNGNHWYKLCLYTGTRNPLLPPILTCNTYWYDKTKQELFSWNVEFSKWDDALAVYHDQDPTTLDTGDYWYDETLHKMNQFVGGTWNVLSDILYVERDSDGNHPKAQFVKGYDYWYIPSTAEFFRRNLLNTEWEIIPYVSFVTDPRTVKSGSLWWNSSPSIDDLFVWDELNSQWVNSDTFYQTERDPSCPPVLPECAVWYNPDTNVLQKIIGTNCKDVDFIRSTYDPTNLPIGVIWQNADTFKEWDGSQWNLISVIRSSDNPYSVQIGEFWFNPDEFVIYSWTGTSWEILEYSSIPLAPKVGTVWVNTVTNIMYEWNGSTWIEETPFAKAELIFKTKADDKDVIRFSTKRRGCSENFRVLVENDTLFAFLTLGVLYFDPVWGSSAVGDTPMYRQLGVGDDGSPDERRDLHNTIRLMMGYPSVQTELTKEQLDVCIDNALMVLRKNSNLPYRRGMFFLDVNPNQQVYILSNKCVGFNEIVRIQSIHRMRTGAFKTGYAHNDIFSFAAIQQLYNLGTFDMLTFHLSSAYIEELETLFAARIMFQWVEKTRELRMHQAMRGKERLLIDCVTERTEQDLFTDRETRHWIQRWAVAEAKMMLSQIRGKFLSLPGPTGSTTLNSQELITQSEANFMELMQEISDMNMQDSIDVGMRSHFVLG